MTDQICNQVRQKIRSGELSNGDKLPTFKGMQKATGLSVSTLQKAFGKLADENLIIATPRLGIFINSEEESFEREDSNLNLSNGDKKLLSGLCVGIVLAERGCGNRHMMHLIEEFESILGQYKAKTILIDHLHDNVKISEIEDRLNSVNAVFYISLYETNEVFVKELIRRKLPLVTYNYRGVLEVCNVCEDWHWSMREIMTHLTELGHRRIALATLQDDIINMPRFNWAQERENAFLESAMLEELPLSSKDIYKSDCDDTGNNQINYKEHYVDIGRRIGEDILSQPHDYTAIVSINDAVARGVMEVAKKRGIKVPEDISIAGFDNDYEARIMGLTTIVHPSGKNGQTAAEMLIDAYLHYGHNRVVKILNKPQLIVRSSTGPVK